MKIHPLFLNFKSVEPSQNGIERALKALNEIKFEQNDVLYMRSLGVDDIFKSGKEAHDFIIDNKINVKFVNFDDPQIHAQWDHGANSILINARYESLTDDAGVLAVSEAIIHEAGHAKDLDDKTSLQEELSCLALNVLGHRYHKKTHKGIFEGQASPLFKEGVSLYEKLFFEFDLDKTGLKKRVKEKYGTLEPSSPGHAASKLALDIQKLDLMG